MANGQTCASGNKLGYVFTSKQMAELLSQATFNGLQLMGIRFEMKQQTGSLRDELIVVPVYSDLKWKTEADYSQQRIAKAFNGTDGAYNAFCFNGPDRTPHPEPEQNQLFTQFEEYRDVQDCASFAFFDAPTLQLAVNQANEFVISGARVNTATLLEPYEGQYGESDNVFTIKIEVGRAYPDGNPPNIAAAYMFGQPCPKRWYYAAEIR